MAYAFVQVVQGTIGQTGTTSTVTITATAGNLLVLGSRQTSDLARISSISDSQGGTWANTSAYRYGNSSARDLWYSMNATGGSTVITVTYDRSATVACPMVAEYSGIKTSGALEGGASIGTNGAAVSTLTTGTITPTSSANYLMVAFGHLEATRTLDAFSGYTSRAYYTDTTKETRWADKRLTSDAGVTLNGTLTGGTGFYTLHAAVFEEAVTGPTINTQPTADTVILTNESTATFTVAATTSGGSLTYDWELETSVGGGVYANLSDGSGATWTGQTAASCSATLTAKTLSGRRVRCNVTDSNGTTTSTAVALTIYDGPQLTTFGPTNGSGVSTATLTCDYVTGVGEAIEVRIPLSDGDVAVTVTTT
tara:strand:+ start:289 stop:1389 length:1101 start_codon:yes stop_codon:yes gene_type:complete